MLYSKQWRQLSDWSSSAPLWVTIGITPILPVLMVLAGICYLPRVCAIGVGVLAIAYGLLQWNGAPPMLLGRELAKALIEFYLLTAVTLFFGLMELAVKRLFTKNPDKLNRISTGSDEPSDPPRSPFGRNFDV